MRREDNLERIQDNEGGTSENRVKIGKISGSLMCSNYDTPSLWKVTKEYTWLSPEDIEWLKKFEDEKGFDYGDIMAYSSYFFTKDQLYSILMTNEHELEKYCQVLWHRPWENIYRMLLGLARKAGVDVIKQYAQAGNSTAMALFGHSVMKLDQDDANNSMKVVFVNDMGKSDEKAGSDSQAGVRP